MKKLFAVSLMGVVISMILQSLGEGFISFILLATAGMICSASAVAIVGAYFDEG